MKPISLKIQAFGPFVEPAFIDFNEFKNHRLFLIHGQTGAGKTTIFDAICFALYGTTTFREASEMRSAFASESLHTSVEYLFSIRGKYYFIKRGFRLNNEEMKSEVLLYETDKNSGQLSSPTKKIPEVNNAIKKIIGFSVDQFRQIVILPQGKFDELLRASSDKKMPILKEIFGAHMYEKISKNLEQVRKKIEDERKITEGSKEQKLISLNVNNIEELDDKLVVNIQEANEVNLYMPQLKENYQKANKQYQQAEALSKEFEKFESAFQRLKDHLTLGESITDKKQKMNNMEKAEQLKQPYIILKNHKKDIIKLNQILDGCIQEINRLKKILFSIEFEEENIENLKLNIEKNSLQINDYKDLSPKYKVLQDLIAQQNILKDTGIKQNKSFENIKAELKELKTRFEQNKAKIDTLNPLEKNKTGLEQELKRLNEVKKVHAEYMFQHKELLLANRKLSRIVLVYDGFQKEMRASELEYERIESQWRRSQSALLAIILEDGVPCPVCGALSHPVPAQSNEDTVSDEMLNQARKIKKDNAEKYENALAELNETKQKQNSLETQVKTLASQISEFVLKTESEMLEKIEGLTEKTKQAQDAEKNITSLKNENVSLEKQIIDKNDLKIELDKNLISLRKDYETDNERIKELKTEIPDTLQDLRKLNEEITRLENQNLMFKKKIKDTEQTKDATSNAISKQEGISQQNNLSLTELNEKYKIDHEDFLLQLANADFINQDDFEKHLVSDLERKQLKTQIEDWDNVKLRFETEVNTIKVNITEKEKPDVGLLKKVLDEHSTTLDRAKEQLIVLNKDLELYRSEQISLLNINKELDKLKEEESHITILSQVANGKKVHQKFEAYVLSVFMQEVLEYANNRLANLSNNRYILFLKNAAGSSKDETLDLEVLDSYNNKRRDVKSLSGGETFFTSLSLALALADVATVKSGGIRLDSIFIDEGFGTLDAETLDKAIDALISIEGEHRMIGIISHVTELKERIPGRLEVIKGKNGSTLKVVA